ncbi:calcium-binding protein [Allosphingosinicella deserti]|uniref:Peptidase M10 serralysin C-terminal domain-containing protein n=1 Tax=Allosphingosinicella deserti TaxID=2116704 RepID=A0A2P7QZC1_9SPHN|nr:calcium-binding protein [Sphingomonas deserti]PSJ43304.1 hypothetical protein C7I55_02715 [Sphingomonas deserti]
MAVIKGNARSNHINGTNRADTIYGYDGDDSVYSSGGADTIHLGRGNDIGAGGEGADRIYGNSGDDTLRGEAGNDRLYGGIGGDRLFGGLGNDLLQDGELVWGGGNDDVFQFTDAWAKGNYVSRIVDFTGDKIDLSLIDANENVAGNQSFRWIGSNAFSGQPGELKYINVVIDGRPAEVQVWGDTDGDRLYDFSIYVEGYVAMTPGDFIL